MNDRTREIVEEQAERMNINQREAFRDFVAFALCQDAFEVKKAEAESFTQDAYVVITTGFENDEDDLAKLGFRRTYIFFIDTSGRIFQYESDGGQPELTYRMNHEVKSVQM